MIKKYTDLILHYGLPSINRVPEDSDTAETLKNVKVFNFAKKMPIQFQDIVNHELYTSNLRSSIIEKTPNKAQVVRKESFHGENSSQLNSFISSLDIEKSNTNKFVEIHIINPNIEIDEPVLLWSNIIIYGNNTVFFAENSDIAVIGNDVENVKLIGINIVSPKICGIMLLGCSSFYIENISVQGSGHYGVVIRKKTNYCQIYSSRFNNNNRAGIMIHDGSHHVYINNCEVSNSTHSSNWSAGIVISSLEAVTDYGIQDAFEPSYFYPKDLSHKHSAVPHQNLLEACFIHHNQASGIYVDGGNGNVLVGNTITDNDKEGICLDFYSATNITSLNIIANNGFRQFQSDDDLQIDHVLEFGRLADNSAAAKLPNISIDNAAYNLILKNSISGAAGDGIKIVRSGFRNIFGMNSITDNNRGNNSIFSFSGILLGSAGCEIDLEQDRSGLDRLPSIENMIFANVIYGLHTAGIVFDGGSVYNDTIDNMIMKQTGPAVIVNAIPNSMVGNNFQKENINENENERYFKILIKARRVKGFVKRIFKLA